MAKSPEKASCKNVKNMHEIDYKRISFYSMRGNQEEVTSLTSAGHVYIRRFKFFATLRMSVNGCKSVTSIDLGSYKYMLVSGQIHKYRTANNEDGLYLFMLYYFIELFFLKCKL